MRKRKDPFTMQDYRLTHTKQRHIRRHPFNLIEIMIVVVIIGMILGMVGPNLMKSLDKAKHKTAANQITILGNAVKDYYLDMAKYPDKLEDLISGSGDEKWDGPYLDPAKIPQDPWGEEYTYEVTSDGFKIGCNKLKE